MVEQVWFARYVALKASIIMMLTKIQLKAQKNSYGFVVMIILSFCKLGKKMTEHFTKLQK